MTNDIDSHERIAGLERDVAHIAEDMAEIKADVKDIRAQANRSRGAFYALMGVASVVGGAFVWLLDRVGLKNL